MIDKKAVRLWVDALRSGDYKQTNATLTRVEHVLDDVVPVATPVVSHCCLGVACEVAIKNGLDLDVVETGSHRSISGTWIADVQYDGSIAFLPDAVMHFYGFDRTDPIVTEDEDGYNFSAVAANDELRWDFDKIADAVEERYLS